MALEMLIIKKNISPFLDRSRLFIYNAARVMEGTIDKDDGTYVSAGVKVAGIYGCPLESDWPYDHKYVFVAPPPEIYQKASTFKVSQYLSVATGNVEAARKILAQGYPIILAMDCFESFLSPQVMRNGWVTKPGPKEKNLGGHAVVIVGYNDSNQCFIVRNSWGPLWGIQGYFFMPYTYYQEYTFDPWTIIL